MPECKPIIPAQPKEARYGIEKLYTSPRLTRATYKEIYGEEAPAYDPKRRIKRWFFTDRVTSNPETNLLTVTVWDATTRTIREMGMKESEVSTPNLPGAVSYPKYVNPAPTSAVIVGPHAGDKLALNGATLVDPIVAQGVVDEINAALGTAYELKEVAAVWPWNIAYGAEPRRQMKMAEWDMAAILKNRFSAGVGAPGRWQDQGAPGRWQDQGAPGRWQDQGALGRWQDQGALGPVFIPEVPNDGEQDLRPEIPMPCRPLAANERIESGFGGLITIVRTDLTVDEPAPGTGGLTAEQDKILRDIAAAVGIKP